MYYIIYNITDTHMHWELLFYLLLSIQDFKFKIMFLDIWSSSYTSNLKWSSCLKTQKSYYQKRDLLLFLSHWSHKTAFFSFSLSYFSFFVANYGCRNLLMNWIYNNEWASCCCFYFLSFAHILTDLQVCVTG